MQYGNSTGLYSIMGITKAMQGLAHCTKGYFIIHPVVPQADVVKTMGYGKYYVVILYRKRCPHQFFDPYCLFGTLAFRTMPVATTIVAVANSTTMVTSLFVSAQRGRATLHNIMQNLYLLWRELIFIG